jgi:hypothetical protein
MPQKANLGLFTLIPPITRNLGLCEALMRNPFKARGGVLARYLGGVQSYGGRRPA